MKKLFSTMLLVGLATLAAHAQGQLYPSSHETLNVDLPLNYSIQNNEVLVGKGVSFAKKSAVFLPSSFHALQTIKKFLDDKSYITLLRVEGHTADGDEEAQSLSEKRAIAVCNWLVAEGIDCKRLLPVGFGATKPISADNAEMNERIVFVNAALRNRAIGGMPVDGGGKVAGEVCK